MQEQIKKKNKKKKKKKKKKEKKRKKKRTFVESSRVCLIRVIDDLWDR